MYKGFDGNVQCVHEDTCIGILLSQTNACPTLARFVPSLSWDIGDIYVQKRQKSYRFCFMYMWMIIPLCNGVCTCNMQTSLVIAVFGLVSVLQREFLNQERMKILYRANPPCNVALVYIVCLVYKIKVVI